MNNKPVKAVILAAGKGTRMKSALPKVMHKIFEKTLLERAAKSVISTSLADEIFIIIGHQAELTGEFIHKIYSNSLIPVSPVLQEPQLGTGDAVFKVYDRLKSFEGNLLILCGDTPLLRSETLAKLIEFHNKNNSKLTLMSAIVDNPTNYGRVIRDENDNLCRIVEEKDATDNEKLIKEINTGVYCIDWQAISPAFFQISNNNKQGEYYLTDIVDWACKNGLSSKSFILDDVDEIFGINSREDLIKAGKILNKRTLSSLINSGVTIISPENTWISPETAIGQDSVVYPGCFMEGENSFGENCILGPDLFIAGNVQAENNVKITQSRLSDTKIAANSTIGPYAHLRDGVEIAAKVRVGNFVEIKKSRVDHHTNISHLSYIGDSELGSNVNIGAGTITANYNALTKEKSKTLIEDGVKIGSNSVLIAPVTISKEANVAAGSVITKSVPESSLAIARGQQKVIENWVKKKINELNSVK